MTNRHVVEESVKLKQHEKQISLVYDMPVAAKIWVILHKKAYEADVVHVSGKYDLSILHIDAADLPYFRLADYDPVTTTSQDVFALGFPGAADILLTNEEMINDYFRSNRPHFNILDCFSEDKFVHSLTKGIVSRIKVEESPRRVWIQHTATINKGNSGGPLCNANGTVVGVNTLGEAELSTYFSLSTAQLRSEISAVVKTVTWSGE